MENFTRQYVSSAKLPPQVVEKWSASVLAEGFVPFPKKLLRCLHRLFPGAEAAKELAVLLAVVDFKRPNLTRLPSLAYLAFIAGLDEQEFKAVLNRLKEKGFVRISGHDDGLDISLTEFLETVEAETR